MAESITVQATIKATVGKVWELYNTPDHIMQWNNPSNDWHTTRAENDLREGGNFIYRMEAKDGSAGFDFGGTYDEVVENSLIRYTMGDGRKVTIRMVEENGLTFITVTFDPENENEPEFQKAGWQGILDNFKSYVEMN